MTIADNFSIDPGQNNKAPPLGAPEGAFPRKQISDTFRVLMAAVAETNASVGSVGAASDTKAGLIELANGTEVILGTDGVRAVTPLGLAQLTATETRRGLVEMATTGEAIAGTDTTRAVTAAGVAAYAATVVVPAASTTVAGKVELATEAEAGTGTDTTRAVTPAGLMVRTSAASTTNFGIVEVATQAECLAGTDFSRTISPGFFASNLNKANPGYIRYPGGMMKQFGFTTTGSLGVNTINYSPAFSTIVLSIQLTPLADAQNYMCRVKTSAANAFTCQMFTPLEVAAPAGITFFWEATGY